MSQRLNLASENDQMMGMLALMQENKHLRAACLAAGLPVPVHRESLEDLVSLIASLHDLEVDDLKGITRTHGICVARQHFMWAARQEKTAAGHPRWSLPQIGRVVGRDHTTVMHGVVAHERRASGLGA